MRRRPRLSYANVVASLALFVALGGSAVAAFVVTSDDIKDGTIRQRDLSPSVRSASTRPKPRLVFRRSRFSTVRVGDTGQALAYCPRGLVTTSGGATTQAVSGEASPLVITGSQPAPPEEDPRWAWVVDVRNTGTERGKVEAFVICQRARGPEPGTRFPVGE
ncbi:MAG: hypothetical protein QOJ14_847 [Thermoleophilaceae bacterium]|nr:hypothetical protein [Thermoleophilaceae bacterium]